MRSQAVEGTCMDPHGCLFMGDSGANGLLCGQ